MNLLHKNPFLIPFVAVVVHFYMLIVPCQPAIAEAPSLPRSPPVNVISNVCHLSNKPLVFVNIPSKSSGFRPSYLLWHQEGVRHPQSQGKVFDTKIGCWILATRVCQVFCKYLLTSIFWRPWFAAKMLWEKTSLYPKWFLNKLNYLLHKSTGG